MQSHKKIKNNTKCNVILLLVTTFLLMGFCNQLQAQKKYVVVLDAGHGGKDPGNLGNGYKEKRIVLKVVMAIGRELQKEEDIKVVYTRRKDVFVELHKRAKIANENKADLFISVHCDSYTSARAYGAGTFVLGLRGNATNLEFAKKENAVIYLEDDYEDNYDYDPNSPESVIGLSVLQEENLDNSLRLASIMQNKFAKKLKRLDRSVKQANFLVLRQTVMPSVLVELGFLTNKKEGKYLNSKKGQLEMAKAVAKAIKKYINQLKQNRIDEVLTVTMNEEEKPKPIPAKTVKKEKKKVAIKKNTTPQKEKVVQKKVVKPVKKQVKKEVVVKPVKNTSYIEFKVQIAASKKYISEEPKNFKGLTNVEMMFYDDYYKYFYGSTSNFQTAKEMQTDARRRGHKGAFVVAFENGVKISLKEALRKQ